MRSTHVPLRQMTFLAELLALGSSAFGGQADDRRQVFRALRIYLDILIVASPPCKALRTRAYTFRLLGCSEPPRGLGAAFLCPQDQST
jgi:hypothetical protein